MRAAIIQTRIGSTRFPGKVLADILGKPMVQRVIERVKAASLLDEVIMATTDEERETPLIALAKTLDVQVFPGSAEDVLDRHYQAAKSFGVEVIARVTSDCPLADPSIIDKTMSTFLEGDYDYVSTAWPVATFPDGLDVEVFSVRALERAWREASLRSEREHVTSYMWKNPDIFRLKNITNSEDLSDMRWTVDEEKDLQFVVEIYRHLDNRSGRVFGMQDVLDLIGQHPELLTVNQGIGRNEGYYSSVRGDRSVSAPGGNSQ